MTDTNNPEGKRVEIGDGLTVHYHDVGGGFPVVFLHGSGPGASGWSNFHRNYPVFARRGFRCLVPDTLGFGRSSKPDNVDYTLEFLAGGLTRFLNALRIERCALVGNSHGGALAIQQALDRPDRVSGLVLMAPGGLEPREAYMKMEGIRAMMKAFLGPDRGPESREGLTRITREDLRRVLEFQLHDPALLTDEIVDERLAVALTQPKRVMASMSVPHLAPRLAALRCPVLGLWGMNDRFCPVSGAMTIASSCGRAQVLLLSDAGHWVMIEHADLFNRTAIDFLERLPDVAGGPAR